MFETTHVVSFDISSWRLNLEFVAYDMSQNKIERFTFVLSFKRENQKYMKKKISSRAKKAVNKTYTLVKLIFLK